MALSSPFLTFVLDTTEWGDMFPPLGDPLEDIIKNNMKTYFVKRAYLPILKQTRSINIDMKKDSSSIHISATGTLLGKGILKKANIILDKLQGKRKVRFCNKVTLHRY